MDPAQSIFTYQCTLSIKAEAEAWSQLINSDAKASEHPNQFSSVQLQIFVDFSVRALTISSNCSIMLGVPGGSTEWGCGIKWPFNVLKLLLGNIKNDSKQSYGQFFMNAVSKSIPGTFHLVVNSILGLSFNKGLTLFFPQNNQMSKSTLIFQCHDTKAVVSSGTNSTFKSNKFQRNVFRLCQEDSTFLVPEFVF